jgi:hypothetical protein
MPYQSLSVPAAADAALWMMGGGAPAAEERALGVAVGKTLGAKAAPMYNPPRKTPRPYEADYPGGGLPDASGRLQFDIEGRPLNPGAHISGRRLVGGPDEAISPAQYDAIAEGSIGSVPEGVAARSLPRGTVGGYREVLTPAGTERGIAYLNTLSQSTDEKVIGHELGHAFDEMSGQMPTTGLNSELRQIYNTLNTGRERATGLTGPQHLGYSAEEAPREMMAEAIRAYMSDPNYIKTVAPRTAARIRQYVNSNPRLIVARC